MRALFARRFTKTEMLAVVSGIANLFLLLAFAPWA
jgi:hypothetical protein